MTKREAAKVGHGVYRVFWKCQEESKHRVIGLPHRQLGHKNSSAGLIGGTPRTELLMPDLAATPRP